MKWSLVEDYCHGNTKLFRNKIVLNTREIWSKAQCKSANHFTQFKEMLQSVCKTTLKYFCTPNIFIISRFILSLKNKLHISQYSKIKIINYRSFPPLLWAEIKIKKLSLLWNKIQKTFKEKKFASALTYQEKDNFIHMINNKK